MALKSLACMTSEKRWKSCWDRKMLRVRSEMKRLRGLTSILLPCLVLSACSFGTKPVLQLPAPPLQEATIERLVDLLKEREAEIQTFKGLFRAQIQGPGIPGTQQVEGAVVYHRPDALRLRGFNRLGLRLFELTVGEERYTLRLVTGKVLTGTLNELNRTEKTARPFRLSLLAMTGVTGTPAIAKEDRVIQQDEGDRYRLEVFASHEPGGIPHAYRQIWFDRRTLQVVQENRLTVNGDIESTVRFDDFRPVFLSPDEANIVRTDSSTVRQTLKPFAIHAEDPEGQSSLQLTFREMSPNLPLKAEELQITMQLHSESRTK